MARRRASGEGTIRKRTIKRKDGTTYVRYFARITLSWDGRKKLSKDSPLRATEREAKTDLSNLKQQQARGMLTGSKTQTLRDYLQAWLEQTAKTRKFRTYQTYNQDLTNHVLPHLGYIRLDNLKKTDVQNMIHKVYEGALAKGKKGAATARKARAALRIALQDAVDLDILTHNPCIGVKVPAEQRGEVEMWEVEEALRYLVTAASHRLYPVLYTAITTGLREGELLALTWDDLELDAPQPLLHVRRSLTRVPKIQRYIADANPTMTHLTGEFYVNSPKTKKSQTTVTLPPDTVTVLKRHRLEQDKLKHAYPERYEDYGLVFPTRYGTPLSPNTLLDTHYALVEQAGVPRIKLHALRHTHATHLLISGVDLPTVADRLRHSDPATTLRFYARVIETRRQRVALTVEALFKPDPKEEGGQTA